MEVNSQYRWWRVGERYNPEGIDIFEEDWDVLIILDALRADDFRELNTLPGDLTTKQSRGGGTIEFLEGNVKGRDLTDVVYVTGNPQYDVNYERLGADFHEVRSVWKTHWDDDRKTVLPESMAVATIEAAEAFPDKRILSHFVQPHEPFIGPTAERHDLDGWIEPDRDVSPREIVRSAVDNVLRRHDSELYRRAYRENIELTLPHVETIFDEIEGKLVVTSDHGEMFGERATPIPIRYDSHRQGCHTDILLTVPWLEYTSGERREVARTESTEQYRPSADVEDRLRDLGYT